MFGDSLSKIRPLNCSKLGKNPKNDNDATIFWHDVIVKCFWWRFVSLIMFSYWPKFHVNIITVLKLWTFSFTRDWPEMRNREIRLSESCPISGDWSYLWIRNLPRMSLIKCYWMLQNAMVTVFIVFELLRKN